MSEQKWTEEQLQAINARGCNLLVAAAAGAGKTAVLVERIIRRITAEDRPSDIDRLLVVTFTNAAASEMRERIANAVALALDKNPDSQLLQRQLALLNKASIMTIHSFCLDVIRNNFHLTDLNPDFGIADEAEAELLKSEVLLELFESKYESEQPDENFIRLLDNYAGNRDDTDVQNMILNLYEFVQSSPWPQNWLDEKTQAYIIPEGADFSDTSWGSVLTALARHELEGCIDSMSEAQRIALYSEGLQPYHSSISEEQQMLEELMRNCCGTWDQYYIRFNSIEFKTLKRCAKNADKEAQEKVRKIRDEVKKRIKALSEGIFNVDSAGIREELLKAYPAIKSLAELVSEFTLLFSERKKERNLLDFNDLEHYCLKILADSGNNSAAAEYRKRYDEILVDEYQDSNLVQEAIIKAVSREEEGSPNIFMVGDVKQSIYRFRQAKPELFLEKYNTYPSHEGADRRKIQLFKNFRSRCEVIGAVNFIFRRLMTKSIGELDYTKEEELNAGADFPPAQDKSMFAGGLTELHILNLEEADTYDAAPGSEEEENGYDADEYNARDNSDDEQEDKPDNVQLEARLIAQRIKGLTNVSESGAAVIFDTRQKLYRRIEYRDIVILLRSTRNWSGILADELGKFDIPVFTDTGTGYFKTIEVQTVISLLQIIDNPLQDIPLLSVLKSPVGMFNTNELVDIRLSDKSTSIHEALRRTADGSTSTAQKAGFFIKKLNEWRNRAGFMSTSELVWYLYEDTGYYSFVGALPGGLQRQANLRLLFERARKFEKTSYKGLFNFINFVDRLKANQGDMGSAKILGENENVVRIMSIHKSKGLEFPVVILAGMGKRFNLQDMNKTLLLHQDLGFGPDFIDSSRRLTYSLITKFAIRYKMKLENLSEEVRVLYVALTRAREKLIITGTVKNMKASAKIWNKGLLAGEERLQFHNIIKAKGYMDWIVLALIRHRDCDLLRKATEAEIGDGVLLDDESSKWIINIWNKNSFPAASKNSSESSVNVIDLLNERAQALNDSQLEKAVSERLSWKYKFTELSRIPAKLSVTELKRRYNEALADEPDYRSFNAPIIKKPLFLQEIKGLSAAEKGTALHFVMQHLNLERVSSTEAIEDQIEQMVNSDMLTRKQADSVQASKLYGFFHSEIGVRLLNSQKVYREIPFTVEVKLCDIYKELPEANSQETLILQGVIDCFFEHEAGVVLLDYKTDFFEEDPENNVKKRYGDQIRYYTYALEKTKGLKVIEKAVYLFSNGDTIFLE